MQKSKLRMKNPMMLASGFMFRKDSDKLVDEVNKALKDMIKDGTYEKISEKWFGEDVTLNSIFTDPETIESIDLISLNSFLPLC